MLVGFVSAEPWWELWNLASFSSHSPFSVLSYLPGLFLLSVFCFFFFFFFSSWVSNMYFCMPLTYKHVSNTVYENSVKINSDAMEWSQTLGRVDYSFWHSASQGTSNQSQFTTLNRIKWFKYGFWFLWGLVYLCVCSYLGLLFFGVTIENLLYLWESLFFGDPEPPLLSSWSH